MIETGRYQHIESKFRFCPFCPQKIEDEYHFYLECQIYSQLRSDLFSQATKTVISFPYANKVQKLNILMTKEDISSFVARFTTLALKVRKSMIETIEQE